MADQRQHNGGKGRGKRKRRVRVVALVAVALCAAVGMLWMAGVLRDRGNVYERLATIERARSIPHAENAAITYRRLLADPNIMSLLSEPPEFLRAHPSYEMLQLLSEGEPAEDRSEAELLLAEAFAEIMMPHWIDKMCLMEMMSNDPPESLVTPTLREALHMPWHGDDCPKLAAWLQEYEQMVDRLSVVSSFAQCRFRIASTKRRRTTEARRQSVMCRWALLLTFSANNDVAEGRTASALAKWECLIQMSNHLRQHPYLPAHLLANQIAALVLPNMSEFLVLEGPTETHLAEIEAVPMPTADRWPQYVRESLRVHKLLAEKLEDQLKQQMGFWGRLRFVATRGIPAPATNDVCQRYHEYLAMARGVRILTALKRCHTTTGSWPASLEEIASSLSAAILTDPLTDGPFIYKRASDEFLLYSRGRNSIDENGMGDDWPIWPLEVRANKQPSNKQTLQTQEP